MSKRPGKRAHGRGAGRSTTRLQRGSAPRDAGDPAAKANAGARLEAFAVPGIGEVAAGDDVAALLVDALRGCGETLRDADVVVVSSKVVSKAEGRAAVDLTRELAVASQTERVVAERVTPRGLTRIVESSSGPVLAAAGVDVSNVTPGTVLLLPIDADLSARVIRRRLAELTGARVGVVVSDTAGRPWRDGQVDIAIGAAGVRVTDDLRGAVDAGGQPLEVTVRALADEVASLGDLVKGKLAGTPVAVVRGLWELTAPSPSASGSGDAAADGGAAEDDGPGARALLRPAREDWFRYGHVEAVRAAVGLDPNRTCLPPPTVPRGTVAERLRRAVEVAFASPFALGTSEHDGVDVPLHYDVSGDSATVQVVTTEEGLDHDGFIAATASLGALIQVIRATAWSEDLEVQAVTLPLRDSGGMPTVALSATDAGAEPRDP